MAQPKPITQTFEACADVADLVVAAVMLGASAVSASFFFFVNHRSAEVRSYTWVILEGSVSILGAIMLSEVGKDISYLIWDPRRRGYLPIHCIYAVICSFVVVIASGLMRPICGTHVSGLPLNLVRTRSISGIVSRFWSFAWILFWSDVYTQTQYWPWVLFPLLTAPIAWMSLIAVMTFLRLTYLYQTDRLSDDDKEWEQATSQNEIDAAGLCLSFLACSWLRGLVHGNLQKSHYRQSATHQVSDVAHTPIQIILLAVLSLLSKAVATWLEVGPLRANRVMVACSGRCSEFALLMILRSLAVLRNLCHKLCGWLLLFAMTWAVRATNLLAPLYQTGRKSADDSVQVRAIVAVLCSGLSLTTIGALSIIRFSKPRTAGIMRSLVLMVGFSWRRCYGLGIDFLTQYIGPRMIDPAPPREMQGELVLEIIIGLPIALVLAPALYWHITPITLLSICESEEEQELRKSQLSEDTGIAQPQPGQEDQDQATGLEMCSTGSLRSGPGDLEGPGVAAHGMELTLETGHARDALTQDGIDRDAARGSDRSSWRWSTASQRRSFSRTLVDMELLGDEEIMPSVKQNLRFRSTVDAVRLAGRLQRR